MINLVAGILCGCGSVFNGFIRNWVWAIFHGLLSLLNFGIYFGVIGNS